VIHRFVGLILVSLMAATLSYGASQAGPVAQHATKYLGSLTYDPVDIIRVQGKPPKPQKPVAKPKPIAKPKAVAPRAAARPIASASGRTRSASSLPSRAKNLKWTAPSRATLQRPSVSAGARKLNASTAKLRSTVLRSLTSANKTKAIGYLRRSAVIRGLRNSTAISTKTALPAAKISTPKGWTSAPSKGAGGTVYKLDSRNTIRSMPGRPNSRFPGQQVPYVKVQANGQYYDKNGKVVNRNSLAAHIPASQFKFSNFLHLYSK